MRASKIREGRGPIAFLVELHDIVVVQALAPHEFGAHTKIRRVCGELDNLRVRGARIVGTAAPKRDIANRVNIVRGNTEEVKG